jgi:hypothetical protein
MKKLLTPVSCLVLPLFVAVLLRPSPAQGSPAQASFAQGQKAQGLEERVQALEGQLAAERKRNDETRALLDQTLTYLGSQAKASQALLTALDESEQQGFAVGENWRSRETLLRGLRAWGTEAQSGLPAPPAPQPVPAEAPAKRAARQ